MFKSTGNWFVAIGALLIGVSQYFSFNQKQIQIDLTLNSYIKNVVAQIESVDEEIVDFDKKASLNHYWNASISGKLKSKKIEVYQFTENKPLLWTNSQFQIVPQNKNTFEIVHQGPIHLAKWNRVHGKETWVYVYNVFENQGPKLNPDSLIENQQSILDIDHQKLENGKQIRFTGKYIHPNESRYYIAFKQYSVSIFYDLFFVLGLLLSSFGLYLMLSKFKTQTYSLINWMIWFVVSYLFTFDYILHSFKQLSCFLRNCFILTSFSKALVLHFYGPFSFFG